MPEKIKKLRIKLFDSDMNQISDRLVDPDIEFRKGPKDTTPGPIEIEFFLGSTDDVNNAITYLKQLAGLVPLVTRTVGKRGRKSRHATTDAGHTTSLVEMIDNTDDPNELLKWLRDNSFVGITLAYLKDLGLPIAFSEEDFPKTRFMVKLLKKAKNPLNNSYDPSAIVGWKTKDGKDSLIMFSGQEILTKKTFEGGLKDKITVPAKYKVKFPKYLLQDDRNKFRIEMGKLKEDPELKPSRFYTRWVHDVARENPTEIEFPRIEQIPNPYAS